MITIEEQDLDAALKQPWSVKTCLVAQALLRNGIQLGSTRANLYRIVDLNPGAGRIMSQFDGAYALGPTNQESIAAIRSQLQTNPISITTHDRSTTNPLRRPNN